MAASGDGIRVGAQGAGPQGGAFEVQAFKARAFKVEVSRNDPRKMLIKIASPGVAVSATLH
jgi:hypothetical protein